MLARELIRDNLNNTLLKTDFKGLGERYEGKVRDNYTKGSKRIIIATDRISAFDVVLGTIPFRGQILNTMARYWFSKTKDIVGNHVIDVPDPNVMVTKLASPFPIEMVVRGYLAGSGWRDYEKGNPISGIALPKGMRQYEKLGSPIITPSTKAERGMHDLPISREDIISKKIVEKALYEKIERYALELFRRGSELAKRRGLILVDTKYEFGLIGKEPILIDEIHTPDSSRYWIQKTYAARFKNNQAPEMMDKEYIRQWLISTHNYMGKGPAPELSEDVKVEATMRYVESFERVTGETFKAETSRPLERIRNNLSKGGYLG